MTHLLLFPVRPQCVHQPCVQQRERLLHQHVRQDLPHPHGEPLLRQPSQSRPRSPTLHSSRGQRSRHGSQTLPCSYRCILQDSVFGLVKWWELTWVCYCLPTVGSWGGEGGVQTAPGHGVWRTVITLPERQLTQWSSLSQGLVSELKFVSPYYGFVCKCTVMSSFKAATSCISFCNL